MTFTSHHHGVVDHLGVVSHLDDLHDLGNPQHLSSVDRHGDLPHLCLDLVHQRDQCEEGARQLKMDRVHTLLTQVAILLGQRALCAQ